MLISTIMIVHDGWSFLASACVTDQQSACGSRIYQMIHVKSGSILIWTLSQNRIWRQVWPYVVMDCLWCVSMPLSDSLGATKRLNLAPLQSDVHTISLWYSSIQHWTHQMLRARWPIHLDLLKSGCREGSKGCSQSQKEQARSLDVDILWIFNATYVQSHARYTTNRGVPVFFQGTATLQTGQGLTL